MTVSSETQLDCHVRVITPENIEFEYALAGPFQRLPAFAFDLAVRAFVFVGLMFVLGIFSIFTGLGGAFGAVVAILTFFVFSWFYGIYFEARFNGRTLGKMLFKLRVISTDGRPINATQAALRNLLRLADMCVLLSLQVFSVEAPPAFVIPTLSIGLIVMTISPRMQRLGDLAAGTIVISESRRGTLWNQRPDDLRAFGLAELIPAHYAVSSSLAQTTGLYMENRKRMSPVRRNEIAKHLADPLIAQFGLLPDTGPDLLLCALYVRTFMSDQQQQHGRGQLRDLAPRPSAVKSPSATPGITGQPLAASVPHATPSDPPPASQPLPVRVSHDDPEAS